jgi:DNA-directed RNA polymerase subunit K/omega
MDEIPEIPQREEVAEQTPAFVPPAEPAPPITSRFLFVDVAALRAKQLRRGATIRYEEGEGAPALRKPERIAMEEVQRGLVYYDVPEQQQGASREEQS